MKTLKLSIFITLLLVLNCNQLMNSLYNSLNKQKDSSIQSPLKENEKELELKLKLEEELEEEEEVVVTSQINTEIKEETTVFQDYIEKVKYSKNESEIIEESHKIKSPMKYVTEISQDRSE